jgi:hypothetical protein
VALICVTVVASASPASAAVATEDLTGALTATDLASALAGPGITVTNATYAGHESAGGTFTGGNGIIGLGSGVILSSGAISNVIGPNDFENTTSAFGTSGDTDLAALAGTSTSDAAVLEFDFLPTTSQVQFSYVFSSEEYNEFVNAGFNDAFGFFVNGTNCALVGGSTPVSVDTINSGSNASLFIDNDTSVVSPLDTEMDGLTVVLTCAAAVNSGMTNHMKLAIADAGDSNLDSAVFLGANSFVAVRTLSVATAGSGSGTVTSDPAGIDCGADCSEGYEDGTSVTLTATPDGSSVFDGWSGDCTGTGSCSVTMNGPRNVTATFSASSSCGEGADCDSGSVPPGGSLTTVQGTPGNPVSPADPFALELKNVSGGNVTGTIVEEPCDGTQEGDALCSTPRIAGSAGNFQFTLGGGSLVATGDDDGPRPVTIGKLFFDKSVVRGTGSPRIFYQKVFGGPVIKLRKCNDDRRTECFTLKKLKSGDQVVTVPFKDDPRVTRG